MIDEKKLIDELEAKPFIHGRYDRENGNINFICGIEIWHEMVLSTIENMPKVGEWIPCSERLPEDDSTVLGWLKWQAFDINPYAFVWFDKGEWCSEMYSFDDGDVQAWMPLPEPYKAGDSE